MSCLPTTWKEPSKRRAPDPPGDAGAVSKRPRKRLDYPNTDDHNHAVLELLQRLRGYLRTTDDNVAKVDLIVEATVMLSSVPFSEHLQHMDNMLGDHNIPVVTRSYEEGYMRGRMHDKEQECAMGAECECMMLDPKNQFVGVQFEIPSTTGELANNLCVFCLRKITLLLFYETLSKGIVLNKPIQKYGNIPGQANEYHPSVMLMCPKSGPIQCMPLPIVAHQRNKLSVESIGGVFYVRQHGVYMEDFCKPPLP